MQAIDMHEELGTHMVLMQKAPDVYQLPWAAQTTTLLFHEKTCCHSVVRSVHVPKEHD
jgi:hypothetical protein